MPAQLFLFSFERKFFFFGGGVRKTASRIYLPTIKIIRARPSATMIAAIIISGRYLIISSLLFRKRQNERILILAYFNTTTSLR